MIQCYQFDNRFLGDRSQWRSGQRITLSSMADCLLEKYQSETYSIKYVLSGTEHYFLNGKWYIVRPGEFLVMNKQHETDALIRSKKPAIGMCIHLEATSLNEAYALQTSSAQQMLEASVSKLSLPEVEPLIYRVTENALGHYLQWMLQHLDSPTGTLHLHQEDVYTELAQQFSGLQNNFGPQMGLATRAAIQQELLNRVEKARAVLTEACTEPLTIAAVAQEALLSVPHLYRLFRQVYEVSPYQYLLEQRLLRARQDADRGSYSVTDLAFRYGFANAACFSKAYKKRFGFSPAKTVAAMCE